jgi:hypothetical protein
MAAYPKRIDFDFTIYWTEGQWSRNANDGYGDVAERTSGLMNSSVELETRAWPEIPVCRDAGVDRYAPPATRSEHEVSSASMVIATLWWVLLAYAAGQSLIP